MPPRRRDGNGGSDEPRFLSMHAARSVTSTIDWKGIVTAIAIGNAGIPAAGPGASSPRLTFVTQPMNPI
ncbi:MAG: hypothetical protein NXI02_33090 [Rhodobacteraceae bacterium]|nr:hypothetical protein [Paracoccaceae bacterium]